MPFEIPDYDIPIEEVDAGMVAGLQRKDIFKPMIVVRDKMGRPIPITLHFLPANPIDFHLIFLPNIMAAIHESE